MSNQFQRRFSAAILLLGSLALAGAAHAGSEYHVNLGGRDYVASTGITYVEDQPYGGGFGYVGGSDYITNLWFHEQLVGTDDPYLYFTSRRSSFEYRFDVPNGSYVVTLHMALIHSHRPGGTFDGFIEGVQVLDDFDPFQPGEKDHCFLLRFPVTVSGGRLDLSFAPEDGTPHVNAIDVVPWSVDSSDPAPPDNPIIYDGYRENLIYWSDVFEGDVSKIRVERSASSSGPWDVHEVLDWVINQYADQDVTTGVRYHYRIRTIDVFGNVSSPSRVVSAVPRAVSESDLSVFELDVEPADWDFLRRNPELNDTVPADLTVNGVLVPGCEIRYRGNSSRRFRKKGWKILMPDGVIVDGRDRWNLTAAYAEPTMLLNVLGFAVWAQTSIRTPIAEFTQLQINGTNRGVFSNLEQIGERFLQRWGLDPNSSLYRVIDTDMGLLGSEAEYMEAFEKQTNLDEGYDDIIAFVELINNTSDANFPSAIASVLDIDTWLDWYSTQILLENDDFTHRDHFYYFDPSINKWTMFVWDMDSILTINPNQYILTGTEGHEDTSGINVLVDRMMDVPQFREAFALKILNGLQTFFSESEMNALIDDTYATAVEDALRDRWKLDQLNNSRYAQRPGELKDFVAARIEYLEEAVQDLLPDDDGGLVVNEIMASNNATIADEFGEYDDWIEIYNAGTLPRNLGGMFLTDDLDDSQKFELPSVALSAGEHIIIWCDDQVGQGPRHAPFRLSGDGEAIGLYESLANGNVLVDSHIFGPQISDVSEGRLPDGADNWIQMPTPTPGAVNVSGGVLPPDITEIIQVPEPDILDGEDVWVCAVVETDTEIELAQMFVSVDGGAFAATELFDDGAHRDAAPNDGIFGNKIPGRSDGTDVLYYVEVRDVNDRVALSPEDAPAVTHGYTVGYTSPRLALNELMASNSSTIQDEAGEYDDWIEIVNYGTSSVNLSTIALANVLGAADGWMLPDVSLGAGDFLLVWADEDELQGNLHASFKLSALGEAVGLIDTAPAVPLILDEVAFGPQTSDVSWARDVDAIGDWRFDDTPSPGFTNAPGGFSPSQATVEGCVLTVCPNPARDAVHIVISDGAPADGTVRVYDVAGRHVAALPVPGGADIVQWSGRTDSGALLKNGVYFVRYESAGEVGVPSRLLILR